MGVIPISLIIRARRLNYLHSILRREHSSMLYKFFITQWHNPSKGDWTEQVKTDLDDFKIPINFEFIAAKSREAFKKLVKTKASELALVKLLETKAGHTKLENLEYYELGIQDYFKRDDITNEHKQMLFTYRTRMAEFGENYRGGSDRKMCPYCNTHIDSQALGFQCPIIQSHVKVEGDYRDIFSENIPIETIETLKRIMDYRKQNQPTGAHVTHCSLEH